MGKSLVVGAIALLSVLFLTSCGPEKSSADREMEQLNRNLQKNKSDNDQVSGWYLGKLDYIRAAPGSGLKSQIACIYIYSSVTFVDMPGRGEKIQIPVMGAYVFLKGGVVTYNFGSSVYDVDSQMIRFNGSTGYLLELNVNGNNIYGNFYSMNSVSDVGANRTSKDACTAAVF